MAFYPLLVSSFPWAELALLREEVPNPQALPKLFSGLTLPWASGRRLLDPQHRPAIASSLQQPLYRVSRGQPPSLRGRPQLPLFPRRHSRDVFGKINRTLDPSLGCGETAARP